MQDEPRKQTYVKLQEFGDISKSLQKIDNKDDI